MNLEEIIAQGEGVEVEFKKAASALPTSLFETICAFLNRKGGYLFLGVDDDGTVLGVDENSVQTQLDTLKDVHTGKEGYTLAAALLFGTESTLASVLPHYKTDALCRKVNTELYDDRDDIRCNLLGVYYRLLEFIHKHLPDRAYLDGTMPIIEDGDVFKLTIWHEAEAVGVNVGVNVGANEILNIISENEGINGATISEKLPEVTKRTVERYLQKLRESGVIEFRGASKTGGYYILKPGKHE